MQVETDETEAGGESSEGLRGGELKKLMKL